MRLNLIETIETYIFISNKCLMKTVVIYHEAVSKLIFMKISFIIKIMINGHIFHYLLILSFILEIIVYLWNSFYFWYCIHHFWVYLSELIWSEFVRVAIFTCFSLFVLQRWIYVSFYLTATYLLIDLWEVICPIFLKAVHHSKQYHLSKLFIVKFRFKKRLLSLCFKWLLQRPT